MEPAMAAPHEEVSRQHLENEVDSLTRELLHTYQVINVLYAVAEKLYLLSDERAIARIILEEIQQEIPAGRIFIATLPGDRPSLKVLAAKGLPSELGEHPTIPFSGTIVGEALSTGKPLLVNDLREFKHLAVLCKEHCYSHSVFGLQSVPFMAVPIKFDQEVLGTINLADKLDGRRDFSSHDLKLVSAIAGQAAVAFKRAYLYEDLRMSQKETEEAFFYTVEALARAAETHDEDTGEHIVRVGLYSQAIAKELGLPESFHQQIFHFAQMHDVGKIHIDPAILRKPGKLTEAEWSVMKSHCQAGATVIGDSLKLNMAREIALTHHERWDGTGYPRGLKGAEIPLSGRIAMLADIYDALRNPRSYKPPYGHEKTYSIITTGDGRTRPGHFDPQVMETFKNIHGKFNNIWEELQK